MWVELCRWFCGKAVFLTKWRWVLCVHDIWNLLCYGWLFLHDEYLFNVQLWWGVDNEIGKVNCLCNRSEPFPALFWTLGIVLAHIHTYCKRWTSPRPGIPQLWYWHGTVRQGSIRFNLTEDKSATCLLLSCNIIYLWISPKVPMELHSQALFINFCTALFLA